MCVWLCKWACHGSLSTSALNVKEFTFLEILFAKLIRLSVATYGNHDDRVYFNLHCCISLKYLDYAIVLI